MTVKMVVTINGETWNLSAPKSNRYVQIGSDGKKPVLFNSNDVSKRPTRVQKQVAERVA